MTFFFYLSLLLIIINTYYSTTTYKIKRRRRRLVVLSQIIIIIKPRRRRRTTILEHNCCCLVDCSELRQTHCLRCWIKVVEGNLEYRAAVWCCNTNKPPSEVHEIDESLLEPFKYLNVPGKNVRGLLIKAFIVWLDVPEDKLKQIDEVVRNLYTASLLVDDIEDNSKIETSACCA